MNCHPKLTSSTNLLYVILLGSEKGILQYCAEHNIVFMALSPLGGLKTRRGERKVGRPDYDYDSIPRIFSGLVREHWILWKIPSFFCSLNSKLERIPNNPALPNNPSDVITVTRLIPYLLHTDIIYHPCMYRFKTNIYRDFKPLPRDIIAPFQVLHGPNISFSKDRVPRCFSILCPCYYSTCPSLVHHLFLTCPALVPHLPFTSPLLFPHLSLTFRNRLLYTHSCYFGMFVASGK